MASTPKNRPTRTLSAPVYGPAARRLRERHLDEQAAGSLKAKHGTPEPEAAAQPVAPSRADRLFRLAKDLRRAGAPARALLKAAAKAARADAASADLAAQEETALAQGRTAMDAVVARAKAEEERRQEAERAAQADEARREALARLRADAERTRLAEEKRLAAAQAAAERARAQAQRDARASVRAAHEQRAAQTGPVAAVYRGRVDGRTPHGALLVMAPHPGGHAARCYAELLRRAAEAGKATPALFLGHASDDDEAQGGASGRGAREDLLALSDLYRMADGFYRTLDVLESEGAPVNGNTLRAIQTPLGGSISSQLVEG